MTVEYHVSQVEAQLPAILNAMAEYGYVIIREALGADTLAAMLPRYHELMASPIEEATATGGRHGLVELPRIVERDPVFEQLMDWPATFPIARQVIGADITLAASGEAYFSPPQMPAWISWHNDFAWMVDVPLPRQNFWVRTTYLLDDVDDDTGPMTVIPGSHRSTEPPPANWSDVQGQPIIPDHAVRFTGKAGDCFINNTEIWHTNTPNTSDRARKLIMLTYKHAWMKAWEENGHTITPAFAQRQTDPRRRQLCGVGVWHRFDGKWDA